MTQPRLDAKRVWGFKKPDLLNLGPFINQLLPGVKIIHVVRDGRDMVHAREKTRTHAHAHTYTHGYVRARALARTHTHGMMHKQTDHSRHVAHVTTKLIQAFSKNQAALHKYSGFLFPEPHGQAVTAKAAHV